MARQKTKDPEGIKTMQDAHPDVPIYTAAIDRELGCGILRTQGLPQRSSTVHLAGSCSALPTKRRLL